MSTAGSTMADSNDRLDVPLALTRWSRARWMLSEVATLTGRNIAHWVRQPGPLVFGLAFPIMLVAMFGFLFGGAMSVPGGGNYREFLMPGMFAMAMLFGVGETLSAVTADAGKGITDRFRSMPLGSASVVLGRCVADMAYSTVVLGVLLVCGLAVGWRADGGLASTLLAVALLLLLRFAFVWVGIYLGLVVKGPEGMTMVQTLEFPVGFLSTSFVAASTMPAWLGAIAEWNPMSSTVLAARELFGNPGAGGESWISHHAVLMAIAWPVLIVAIFLPLAARRYRRLSR